jgi:hypothetical protein
MEDDDDDADVMDTTNVHNISRPTNSEVNDSDFIVEQSQDSWKNPMPYLLSHNSMPSEVMFERSDDIVIVNVDVCCEHNKNHFTM